MIGYLLHGDAKLPGASIWGYRVPLDWLLAARGCKITRGEYLGIPYSLRLFYSGMPRALGKKIGEAKFPVTPDDRTRL